PFSPNISGVAVANGVVYFQSSFNGQFYALDAATGAVLAQVQTGGLSSGPAVSRGQIYLGTGDAAFTFLDPSRPMLPGSVVALGLPDHHGHHDPATPTSVAPLPSAGTAGPPTRAFPAAGLADAPGTPAGSAASPAPPGAPAGPAAAD